MPLGQKNKNSNKGGESFEKPKLLAVKSICFSSKLFFTQAAVMNPLDKMNALRYSMHYMIQNKETNEHD